MRIAAAKSAPCGRTWIWSRHSGGAEDARALKTRVGIATGLVVVGDLVGSERGIVGETPNLAARLQGDCRAEYGGYCRGFAKTSRQSVRTARPRGEGPQGPRRASTGPGAAAGKCGRKPFEEVHTSGIFLCDTANFNQLAMMLGLVGRTLEPSLL